LRRLTARLRRDTATTQDLVRDFADLLPRRSGDKRLEWVDIKVALVATTDLLVDSPGKRKLDERCAHRVTAHLVPQGGVSTDQGRCVVRGGVEPPTFRFSGGRSYQLSYLTLP
jgi:hypothetical protein